MILVVGASGLVGSEICRKLAARGEKVRALIRTTTAPAKVEALSSLGIDLFLGDLKDEPSLHEACKGIEAIISTASSTFSRAEGDSIETVDHKGQLSLIRAAKAAGIDRFVFTSFRIPPGVSFPLGDAKAEAEAAIASMNFTTIQASFFMEAWLSPALGFDVTNATARIPGPGTAPVSWVSFRDVAELCVLALHSPAAYRKAIVCGGPQALTHLEVIGIVENITAKHFQLEHIPPDFLFTQFAQATDPMEKSFAALMLGAMSGDPMDMAPVFADFSINLTSVHDYVLEALGI